MTQEKIRTIAVVGGGWSTNVGNGFYNLGTIHLLKQVFPDDRIVLLCDQESNWDFRYHHTPKNSLRFLDHIIPDYIVLQGCFLNSYFPRMWSRTLELLRKRGTKILFISAALEQYTDEEVSICRDYLKHNPPYVFITRDEVTHSKLSDLANYSYNGIDTAFFVSNAFPPIELDLPPYIVCTFNKLPEPMLRVEKDRGESCNLEGTKENPLGLTRRREFEFSGGQWIIEFPSMRFTLSKLLGKFYPYVEAGLFPGRRYEAQVAGFPVIRADHQCNPWFVRKMYRSPNSFSWDLPEPYLALYANTVLTLSDRIHACVATLAYGNSAMLFSNDPRALILERVGAYDINRRIVTIPKEEITQKKDQMLDFLKSVPFS